MRNFTSGLLLLVGLAVGNFVFTMLANMLNIPYERMALYCFVFALATLLVLIPYFFYKARQKRGEKCNR